MKVIVRRGMEVILILLLSMLAGYLLLAAVYSIPKGRMQEHLEASAYIFDSEGTYPEVVPGFGDSRLDNWTDALMLLTAVYEDGSPAHLAALKNTRQVVKGQNPAESLVSIYVRHDIENVKPRDYGRYWHGYLVLLKPLLYFMGYSSIRYVNMFVQFFLFTWIAVALGRRGKAVFIIPLLAVWLFLNPFSTMLSMQFSAIILLVFVQILLFLIFEEKYENSRFFVMEHFLAAGCMTSYFDLLTYPLVAVGIPLVFWLMLHSRGSMKNNIIAMIEYGGMWGIGYSVMWAGKWLLGSVILKQDLINNAMNQAVARTGSTAGGQEFSYGMLLERLYGLLNKPLIGLGALVLAGYVCWGAVHHALHVKAEYAAVCALAAALPFVWYAVLKNHSYIHMWFAYRELAVAWYAVAMLAIVCIDAQAGISIGKGGQIGRTKFK